jgi:hypothetical protein
MMNCDALGAGEGVLQGNGSRQHTHCVMLMDGQQKA